MSSCSEEAGDVKSVCVKTYNHETMIVSSGFSKHYIPNQTNGPWRKCMIVLVNAHF